MTREEAIDCNKNLRMYMRLSDKNQPCKFLEENYIALDMAIKALEQEPCDDTISRQAVLDGLASIAKAKAKSDAQKALMGRVMFFTEQLSPVTPQPKIGHWIPVSERLPDLWDERYLVSLAWGGVGVMEYKSTGFHNYGSFSPVPIETVTAWMPLPKPYKAESEE